MMSNNTVYKKLGTIILNNLRFFIDLKKKFFCNKFQTEITPTFAQGSKNLFSHVEFIVQILSKLIMSNNVIFSFLSNFGWYWPQKI